MNLGRISETMISEQSSFPSISTGLLVPLQRKTELIELREKQCDARHACVSSCCVAATETEQGSAGRLAKRQK